MSESFCFFTPVCALLWLPLLCNNCTTIPNDIFHILTKIAVAITVLTLKLGPHGEENE